MNMTKLWKTGTRPTVLVLLAILFLLAASCTSSTNTSTSTNTGTNTNTNSTTSTSTTQSSTVPDTGGSGTLNLADTAPITLDPAVAAEATSAGYILQIFSGLTRLDENLNVAPDIAENWDKSTDGKTYTFHLRKNVVFHNGKQVTAADFKYSWERALDPATQSLTAGTYLNDIVGAGDILSGKSRDLSGVKVLDNYTLQVTIDAPKAYFLEKMAYPTAFVVDQSNVQTGSDWWRQPNGTGPFKLKEWQIDQLLVLERNANYYGSRALLNVVQYHLLSGDPLQLYQQNQIDVAPIGAAYMGLVTDPSNPISKELQVTPELSLYYIGFDASKPPFDDVKVRQAFSYAVDKAKIINLSIQDTVAVANGILPPGIPGYNENLQSIPLDPAKAKDLIKASKYGDVANLPPITLTTTGWGNLISGVLGGLIDQWRTNLGVEVEVRQLEPEVFLYALSQEKNNMWDTGWIADYPDPQDFLDILFHSDSQNNYGNYSNPQLDTLLDQAAVTQDQNARLQMYQNAEQIIVQDAAVLPLFFGKNYIVVKPYVKGYVQNPLGFVALNKVSIQQ